MYTNNALKANEFQSENFLTKIIPFTIFISFNGQHYFIHKQHYDTTQYNGKTVEDIKHVK